jgi:hypothetical protein
VGPTMLRMLRIIIRVSASGKIIYLLTCVCCWLIKVLSFSLDSHKMSEKMAFVAIGLLLLSTLYTLMFGGEALLLLATDTSHYVCVLVLLSIIYLTINLLELLVWMLSKRIFIFSVHTDGRTFAARDQTRSGRRPPITH